ncbi:MAG: hypothetical protein ACOZQL_02980 [Myxococcota bacterium]
MILAQAVDVIRALSFAGGHLTIIGGLVPALLVPVVEPGLETHVGTLDLDMCMSVALLSGDVGQYENLQKALEAAGFEVMREDSKPVSWRWRRKNNAKLVVEFLCPVPADGSRRPGELHRPGGPVAGKLSALVLEAGALIASDVRLVKRRVAASKGELEFEFRVAGPLSWLVSKTDALERRDKAKDAYDIVWLCECWPGGQAALGAELRASPLFVDGKVTHGLARLKASFADREQIGPRQFAAFMVDIDREQSLLRAVGAVRSLFDALERQEAS